jgi:hypothetical protein
MASAGLARPAPGKLRRMHGRAFWWLIGGVISACSSAKTPVAPRSIAHAAVPVPSSKKLALPVAATPPTAVAVAVAAPDGAPKQRFPPADIVPPSARSAQADDGHWYPLGEARSGDGDPLLFTTRIHPHETSRFIALTLVAIDLTRVRLEFMPGVDDVGKQQVPFAPGLVPERDRAGLLAAFNGGFMPQHGRWGVRLGETMLLPPRDSGCTIALFADGSVKIRAWPALAASSAQIRALRQTPPCLLEQGEVHADLSNGRDRAWAGQTPGIVTRRRSAVALSADGRTLFYGLGVECSPKLLATGLRAAGAAAAAQLDINWNWTRFLLFGSAENGTPRVTATLAAVEHTKRDYVESASKRDFFYIVRR